MAGQFRMDEDVNGPSKADAARAVARGFIGPPAPNQGDGLAASIAASGGDPGANVPYSGDGSPNRYPDTTSGPGVFSKVVSGIRGLVGVDADGRPVAEAPAAAPVPTGPVDGPPPGGKDDPRPSANDVGVPASTGTGAGAGGAGRGTFVDQETEIHHGRQIAPGNDPSFVAGQKLAAADLGAKRGELSAIYNISHANEVAATTHELTNKLESDQRRNQEARQRTLAILDQKAQEGIDPDRLWKSRGTGARILGGIASALGAFGAGMAHTQNWAQQIIDNDVNNDIAAQRDNHKIYADLYRQYGDEQKAIEVGDALVRKARLDDLSKKFDAYAASLGPMANQQELFKARADIAKEYGANNQTLLDHASNDVKTKTEAKVFTGGGSAPGGGGPGTGGAPGGGGPVNAKQEERDATNREQYATATKDDTDAINKFDHLERTLNKSEKEFGDVPGLGLVNKVPGSGFVRDVAEAFGSSRAAAGNKLISEAMGAISAHYKAVSGVAINKEEMARLERELSLANTPEKFRSVIKRWRSQAVARKTFRASASPRAARDVENVNQAKLNARQAPRANAPTEDPGEE